MHRPVAIAAIMAFAAASPAAAVDRSAEQEQYCTGDAFRLCSSEIPDEERIVACMTRLQDQLSPACRAVFIQAPPAAARPPASRSKPRQPIPLVPE